MYIAEVADDLKTRLYQILNNDFTYSRQSLVLMDKKEDSSFNKLQERNYISILDTDYQELEEEEINENYNVDTNLYLNNIETSENYTLYFNKNGKDNNSFYPSTPLPKYNINNNQNQNQHQNQNQNQKRNQDQKSLPSKNNESNFNEKLDSFTTSNLQSSLLPTSSSSLSPHQQPSNPKSKLKIKDKGQPNNNNKKKKFPERHKSNSMFYHSINIEENELMNHRNETANLMTTLHPFEFSVECMEDEEECTYIKDHIKSAGTYISYIFNIYKTIKVDVHILSFCKHMKKDHCESITALTYAPSFVTLNITGQGIYSYPQALVKQLEINERIKRYASSDISLYFNTDYLKEHNYGNYLLVAAHEIIHGMGFFHLITTASAAFKMNFKEDRVIPQPLAHHYRTSHGEEKAYQGWIPFTVFDRYLVEVDYPDVYIHQGIQEYLMDVQAHKLLSEEAVMQHFENLEVTPSVHAYSKSLVHAFTTREAIGFRTYDGEVVILQTYKAYEPISSISHIHAPFSCESANDCYIPKEKLKDVDDNYLMYYTIITRSLNELVNRYSLQNSYGFIGEKIIKILKTIGWTEKSDLSPFQEYYHMILGNEIKISKGMTLFPSKFSFYISSFFLPILLLPFLYY
jgi:hypothetical protein